MMKWHETQPKNRDGIIVSSRIRLARNLDNYPFPNRINKEEAQKVINDISSAFFSSEDDFVKGFEEVDMDAVPHIDRIVMMERHIVSPLFIGVTKPHSLILSKDEGMSIMINEEDHIRIQSLQIGMNLKEALNQANRLDDILEEGLKYAFNQSLGYLTACPTNVGTGMRASYMVHVPALETTGKLRFLLEAIGKFGLTARGLYGEGSEALGSVFQISNQVTLGMDENEIIENLNAITRQIVEQEILVREKLLMEKRTEFEDAVYRSYGLLSHARILTSKEAMTLLSDVRLGLELNILKTEENAPINIFDLMTRIQPANLQKLESTDLTVEQRDIARASYIRQHLPKLDI